MKEIEVLVEVYDSVDIIMNKLNKYEYIGSKRVIDEYYYDPKRSTLKPNKNNQLDHCLRLRNKNGKYSITYKDDVFENDIWLYSNEYETSIGDINILHEIFDKLGFIKFIEIDNTKETYNNGKYEMVIEKVKNLGLFMEVEYCTNDNVDIHKIKNEIKEFIKELNINVSEELNMGKPEMYIRKNNIKIK